MSEAAVEMSEAAVEVRAEAGVKPLAVVLLQACGVVCVVVGLGLFLWGVAAGFERAHAVLAVFGPYFVIAGLLGILAGWRRPVGFLAGMAALAMLVPAFPVGSALSAIVVTVGMRARDRLPTYYAPGIER